ncbi:hypothetical protein AgCh_022813 [Apium graveolens]
MVYRVPKFVKPEGVCTGCFLSKQRRKPFRKPTTFRVKQALEVIHVDICGPISPATIAGEWNWAPLHDTIYPSAKCGSRKKESNGSSTGMEPFDGEKYAVKPMGRGAHMEISSVQTKKLDDKKMMMYLGEECGTKACLLYNPDSRKLQWFEDNAVESTQEPVTPITSVTQRQKELPSGKKPIGLKLVDKLKQDSNVEVVKYKARLVAKGYVQKKGIDFEEVFAPVTRLETVRLLLAVAAKNGWEVHHMDVKSTFLNGDLEETVYVTRTKGFVVEGKAHMVCKLIKALYGLK